jgi:hypothetical protein
LLDGGEPTPLAMAQRMAALCAEVEQRAGLREQIEKAFRLERLVMRGDADSIYLEAVGTDAPDRICKALEACLRALLRDIVCGHVPADVRSIADEMLGVPSAEPPAAETAPTKSSRFERGRSEPKTEPALDGWDDVEAEPVAVATDAPEPAFVARRTSAATAKTDPLVEEPDTEEVATASGVRELRGEADVDDWGFDDPADYSAAV